MILSWGSCICQDPIPAHVQVRSQSQVGELECERRLFQQQGVGGGGVIEPITVIIEFSKPCHGGSQPKMTQLEKHYAVFSFSFPFSSDWREERGPAGATGPLTPFCHLPILLFFFFFFFDHTVKIYYIYFYKKKKLHVSIRSFLPTSGSYNLNSRKTFMRQWKSQVLFFSFFGCTQGMWTFLGPGI